MGWLVWMGLIVGLAFLKDKRGLGSVRLRRIRAQGSKLQWVLIIGVIGVLAMHQIVEAVANERWTQDTTIFVGTACLVCGAAIWTRPWTRRN